MEEIIIKPKSYNLREVHNETIRTLMSDYPNESMVFYANKLGVAITHLYRINKVHRFTQTRKKREDIRQKTIISNGKEKVIVFTK